MQVTCLPTSPLPHPPHAFTPCLRHAPCSFTAPQEILKFIYRADGVFGNDKFRHSDREAAVLLEDDDEDEDANDGDVNYGFDEEELAELPSTEDNPLGQAKFRSIPGSSDGI